MITSGFTYIAVLVFLAACLVGAEKMTKAKFFEYAPPVVLLYLFAMVLCTLNVWDLTETKAAYTAVKNPVLYSMIFLMLLRCDIRKIMKLGPRMIGGFIAASVSISIAFIATYAVMSPMLGAEAWKPLGALCGSWMGGSGNLIAVQTALNIGEAETAYALVIDSIDYSIWVMFLLWAVTLAPKFNKWVKADTSKLDEVSRRLEEEFADEGTKEITFPTMLFLLGLAFLVAAICTNVGPVLSGSVGLLDTTTWTVLILSVFGLVFAVTPVGKIAGSAEMANVMLYIIIALLASRASLLELTDAPIWILTGFIILAIHAILMIIVAKIFKLDMFTCGVASLANIGGTASAPILAGSYKGSLVPVGVLMALMGYVVGTFGGIFTANMMSLFAR